LMIDVHAHLTWEGLQRRLGVVLESAKVVGVEKIVTCGLGPRDSLRALELSDEMVLLSLGAEPYELDGYEEVMELIIKNRDRVRIVGEVGLDLYRAPRETLPTQIEVFKRFIELAKTLDKPLLVHSRHAGREAIELLLKERLEAVIMHGYDGPLSYARRASERGFMFSVPPKIAISEHKKALVRKLGLESLLLESDSPFLGPVPGPSNEPKNLPIAVEWISRIKFKDPQKVIDKLYDNSLEILGRV